MPCRLLDHKAQELYYNKIVERYMQFCAAAGRDDDTLDRAFASLSLGADPTKVSSDFHPSTSSMDVSEQGLNTLKSATTTRELATLLLSMRKLREGLLASSRTDTFAQRVYIFTIRSALLSSSYEAYSPALSHLLHRIHPLTPLPSPELHEFVGYYILDLACRLGDFGTAYQVRRSYRYRDEQVEGVVKALVHDDWVSYWRLRGKVDGYQRKLMEWAEDGMRMHALKCIGRSYLMVERGYVERCAGRGWGMLKEKNKVGWELDGGDKVIVRRVKVR